MGEVEIKPAAPLPAFSPLPATLPPDEPHKEEPAVKVEKREEPKPRYIWQTLAIAALILASVLFWRYGLKPDLDRMAVDCAAGEVRE